MKIALSLLFLALSIIIPLYYYPVLEFFVISLKSGWVFGSIYIRLIVIILFTIFLYLLFSKFERTKKIKFIYVLLISLAPGFGISFISPIYDVDYGMIDDSFKIEQIEELSSATGGEYQFKGNRAILAFFTTTCPHCKAVSHKLGVNKDAGQALEVNAFFPGTREDTDVFLDKYNGSTFNSYLIGTDEEFTKMAGYTFPSVFVIDRDGSILKHWTGDMINYTALDYLAELEP
ncbi:MAG: hypothetical protein H6582_01425 [Crocinitomicaceae bacterium]|nr:hypothetical protein [Crocinitomicaceae bacterium]